MDKEEILRIVPPQEVIDKVKQFEQEFCVSHDQMKDIFYDILTRVSSPDSLCKQTLRELEMKLRL